MGIQELSAAIDAASAATLKEPRRGHLGPSTLSGNCLRAMYYDFRWASPDEDHSGDMARLLSRGHDEEHKIYRWLRAAGVEVRDYRERLMYHSGSDSYVTIPWEDLPGFHAAWSECDDVHDDPLHVKRATARGQGPKQWGFSAHDGHHSGSSDGLICGLEQWLPEATGWGLAECKTSSEKNFTPLAGPKGKWNFADKRFEPRLFNPNVHGLQRAKPDHYRQMQQYMRQLGLSWGLYMAVNKNTDEIYYEFVPLMPEVGDRLFDIAGQIIYATSPPPRRYSDPSNFECKVCDHWNVCHYAEKPVTNCRSCIFSTPAPDGQWRCNKFNQIIPKGFMPKGCTEWDPVE